MQKNHERKNTETEPVITDFSRRIVKELLSSNLLNDEKEIDLQRLVGMGGLEPPTSSLSGTRSNHLSYTPESGIRKSLNPVGACRHESQRH